MDYTQCELNFFFPFGKRKIYKIQFLCADFNLFCSFSTYFARNSHVVITFALFIAVNCRVKKRNRNCQSWNLIGIFLMDSNYTVALLIISFFLPFKKIIPCSFEQTFHKLQILLIFILVFAGVKPSLAHALFCLFLP